MKNAVFLIKSEDRKGLLSSITTFFYKSGFNILRCQQYTDLYENKYFMRIKLDLTDIQVTRKHMEQEFDKFAAQFKLEWSVHYSDSESRVALMVSKNFPLSL